MNEEANMAKVYKARNGDWVVEIATGEKWRFGSKANASAFAASL